MPSPTFPPLHRFDISPSFIRDRLEAVERERGRTATEIERDTQVTWADIQRAGERLDRSMVVRPSLTAIDEAMIAAAPMPMATGSFDRFNITSDPASRAFRPASTPQRATAPRNPAAAWPQQAARAVNPAPEPQAPQPAQPVRQPFTKHQRAALIATLRELRGPGSSAALDAVARAIATQTPGFDAEEFKTACRELVPA